MTTTTEVRGLSVKEAADRLGISRSLAYKMINDGRIQVIKFAGRVVVSSREVERLLDPGQTSVKA